jgi:hypothetical protein
MSRPTPFDLFLAPLAADNFPRVRASLAAGGSDPADRDAFLMDPEVVTLLRDLRGDEGLGEAMDQMVALLHQAYLAWDAGLILVPVPEQAMPALLGPEPPPHGNGEAPRAYYAQLPERRVWASVVEGEAPEPLDGCFVSGSRGDEVRVLGIFGLRPDRAGFSAVEVGGPRPSGLARLDGTPVFSPTLAGGGAAGLHSITGEAELLELGWRTRPVAAQAASGAA